MAKQSALHAMARRLSESTGTGGFRILDINMQAKLEHLGSWKYALPDNIPAYTDYKVA